MLSFVRLCRKLGLDGYRDFRITLARELERARAHVLDDRPAADVAAEFRMRPNAVYQVKDRVLRAVRRELASFGQGRLPLADLHEALLRASPAGR